MKIKPLHTALFCSMFLLFSKTNAQQTKPSWQEQKNSGCLDAVIVKESPEPSTIKIEKVFFILALLCSMVLLFSRVNAQQIDRRWGDQGNGKFVNPIILADYSDPDVIRVGKKFYMIASEFHYMGIQVLESEDMVNWKVIAQVYDTINLPGYSEMQKYGGGSWAPAIRYHDNKFWVYFCTPQEGLFMSSAPKADGPWSPLHQVKNVGGWEDPCPLWDEDGQTYMGRSQLGGGPIIIHKMSADGKELLDEGRTVYEGPVAEGTKIFKKDGYYYISIPEGGVSTGWQTVLRSKNIYGPYEKKIVLDKGNTNVNGPHQGAFVDNGLGQWWFYHFQSLEPHGRVVHLQPVKWENGWPLVGEITTVDQPGTPVKQASMPLPSKRKKYSIQTSDTFDAPKLGLQWQFNHNPVNSHWSLTDRKGSLMLQAQHSTRLREARNMLSQKQMGYINQITTAVSLDSMANGQKAGLFCIGNNFNGFGVVKKDGEIFLYTERNEKDEQYIEIYNKTIYLRLYIDAIKNIFSWEYSLDNNTYTPLADTFSMGSGDWKGVRLGLFTYNYTDGAGKVYFDNFEYHYDGPGLKK